MRLLLAQPRGFCAGVERAINTVLTALEVFGPPVYVRKQIVHNESVVRALKVKGAVFVDEADLVPMGATLIFSAHGVAPEVYAKAGGRALNVIDATCPLVTKVHIEAMRFARASRPTIIVGHREHEEVVGTRGYASARTLVVSDVAEAEAVDLPAGSAPAVLTQTTFSLDDSHEIIEVLRRRFPDLVTPARDDVCYATQNRQAAVREMVKSAEVILVVGASNSSNSNRLRDIAIAAGVRAYLLEDLSQLRPDWLEGVSCAGITSGASTPEHLVSELVHHLREHNGATVEIVEVVREDVNFALPTSLMRFKRQPLTALPEARHSAEIGAKIQERYLPTSAEPQQPERPESRNSALL